MTTLEEKAEEILAAVTKGRNEYHAYSNDRVCEPRGNWTPEQWAEFQERKPYKPPKAFQIDRVMKLLQEWGVEE